MPSPVFLAAGALTAFGKTSGSLVDLLVIAASKAMEQVKDRKIDAVYLGVMNPESFVGEGNLSVALADRLGIEGAASSRVETASSTGAGALESAFFAVASGYCKNVLVVAGEKMTGLSTDATTRILAQVIDKKERRYGASMPSLAALITKAYGQTYGLDLELVKEGLCRVAMKNHARGALNPFAQFQKEITSEKYHNSKIVADPLCVYDCAPITDGACALVLSGEQADVLLAGIGHATDSSAVARRGSLVSFNSTRQAAIRAYAMAQINPEQVDFAEVHDAFTSFEVIGSEDLGFFPPGEGLKAALDQKTIKGGKIPINASGGLKSRGHPVGASGLAQVVEAFWQLTDQVKPEQRLPGKKQVALCQSIGGLGNNNLVTILTKWPRPDFGPEPWRTKFAPMIYPLNPPRPDPPPKQATGRLLCSTVLYRVPEGFESPLGLALIKTKSGWGTFAHVDKEEKILPNSKVILRLEKGYYKVSQVSDFALPLIKAKNFWQSLPTNLRRMKRRFLKKGYTGK